MFEPDPIIPNPIPPWDHFGAESKYTQDKKDQITSKPLTDGLVFTTNNRAGNFLKGAGPE